MTVPDQRSGIDSLAVPRHPAWAGRLAVACGVAAATLGTAMVVGWIRGFATFGEMVPTLPILKVNTSIGIAAAGLTLLAATGRRAHLRVLAVVPLLIGGATLAEWTTGVGLGIDELVADDPFDGDAPGRPSPQMALMLTLFGAAHLTAGRAALRLWSGALAVTFVAAALMIELGYAFQAPELSSATGGSGVSVMAAVAVLLLMVGTLAANAERRPLAYLWAGGLTGALVRRLLPTVVGLPLALAFVIHQGSDAGWYGDHLATALLAGSMVVVLAAVVATTAASLHALERERARRSAEATDRLRAYLDSAPDATVVVDGTGTIQYANHEVEQLLGHAPEDLAGASVDLLVPEAARHRHASLRAGFTADPHRRQMGSDLQLSAQHKDGHTIPVEVSLGPIETDDGIWIAAAIRDVTARRRTEDALRRAEQRARHLADHDPLTGTWNRRRFALELTGMLRDSPLLDAGRGALLIIDVDHFKSVNDTCGHHAGDLLLTALTECLGELLGNDASLSRLGGDEFAVLTSGDRSRVEQLACAALAATRTAVERCDLGPVGDRVSASIGIALFADLRPEERTRPRVMARADEALYAAKRAGRGRFRLYQPAPRPRQPSSSV